MACKMHRRVALRTRLQILRTLTKSQSVKKSSIIMDAFHYIYKLRLQVEAIQKEYQYLINHIQEVKVEKVGEGFIAVRVRCKKVEGLAVSILEAFEEMDVKVMQARLTCNCKHLFGMEAILKADLHIDASILNQAILNLIQTH